MSLAIVQVDETNAFEEFGWKKQYLHVLENKNVVCFIPFLLKLLSH
jgi:hypothetical protein